MDFFLHQDNARRRSALLLPLMALAVAGMVLVIYFAVVWGLAMGLEHRAPRLWNPELFAPIAGAIALLVTCGWAWKAAHLRDGGAKAVERMGAWSLDRIATAKPEAGRLRNVVEEMSIASGVPVPRVMVLMGQEAINGFVTGTSASNATLVVTEGALRKLSRDELQALVAHEYSHLLNGDTRLNLRLLALLHGILLIAITGRVVLEILGNSRTRSSGRRNKDGDGLMLALLLLGVVLWLVGWIGHFFAHLIKLAIGRQREFLADAAAVQFTRNPDAMAGLLRRIRSDRVPPRLAGAGAMEFSHFFFSTPSAFSRSALLSTHPPLDERIRRILPGWTPETDVTFGAPAKPPAMPRAPAPVAEDAPVGLVELPARPARVAAAVGHPLDDHLRRTHALLAALPPALREATQDALGAQAAVLLTLLLDGDPAAALAVVEQGDKAGVALELRRLLPLRAMLPLEARLPLLDLCLRALRRMTPAQHADFRARVDALARLDDRLTVFELALHHALARHLDANFTRGTVAGGSVRHFRVAEISGALADLWSVLSVSGGAGPEQARAAYDRAREAEAALIREPWRDIAPEHRSDRLRTALDTLAVSAFPLRRLALIGATGVVTHDQRIAPAEAELIRLVADALSCPLPPWLTT